MMPKILPSYSSTIPAAENFPTPAICEKLSLILKGTLVKFSFINGRGKSLKSSFYLNIYREIKSRFAG
jgi:hypothetical protein